jgi:hypothetical protein
MCSDRMSANSGRHRLRHAFKFGTLIGQKALRANAFLYRKMPWSANAVPQPAIDQALSISR